MHSPAELLQYSPRDKHRRLVTNSKIKVTTSEAPETVAVEAEVMVPAQVTMVRSPNGCRFLQMPSTVGPTVARTRTKTKTKVKTRARTRTSTRIKKEVMVVGMVEAGVEVEAGAGEAVVAEDGTTRAMMKGR